MINKLEVQSGLPIGFIGNLQMSAKDRLINVNEKTGEALIIGDDGGFKVVQTGLTPTPTTEKEPSEAKRKRSAFAEVESKLKELGGDDLYVSPEEWKWIKGAWTTQGYSAKDFDEAFRGRFVNPDFDPDDFGLE